MKILDEVFRDRDPVEFIKVDTDGFDFEVLRGAEATLKRDRPILYFELEPRCLIELASSEPIEGLAWLQSLGYRRLVCLHFTGRLIGTTEEPEQLRRGPRQTITVMCSRVPSAPLPKRDWKP